MSEVPLNKYGLPDFCDYSEVKPAVEDDGANKFFTFEGVKYISIVKDPDRPKLLPNNFRLERLIVNGRLGKVIVLKKMIPETGGWDTIIEEVPYVLLSRTYYLQYDYYVNTILQMLKD